MLGRIKTSLSYIPALLLIALSLTSIHYYYEADGWHQKADVATALANGRQDTIDKMDSQRQAVALIDTKHTKELADARAEIESLRAAVDAGTKRLRIAASCPKSSEATSATGMDDATGTRLTDSAERDYFTLRERIEAARSQIAGLQDYISNVCLAK